MNNSIKEVKGEGISERFKMPTDKQVRDLAILFNGGKLEAEKLSDMVALADFIIDRLYENGDITIPSSWEGINQLRKQI